MEKLNDPAYVQELADGDPDHMRELTEYLLPRLRNFISRTYPWLEANARDLTNETMLKIYQNPSVLMGCDRYHILNYIFTAAKNTAINFMNKASSRLEVPLEGHAAQSEDWDEDEADGGNVENSLLVAYTPDQVEAISVDEALKQLTEKERDVIVLIDCIGMTPAEVAENEGVPVNTIHVRHRRARANFKKQFHAAYDNLMQA